MKKRNFVSWSSLAILLLSANICAAAAGAERGGPASSGQIRLNLQVQPKLANVVLDKGAIIDGQALSANISTTLPAKDCGVTATFFDVTNNANNNAVFAVQDLGKHDFGIQPKNVNIPLAQLNKHHGIYKIKFAGVQNCGGEKFTQLDYADGAANAGNQGNVFSSMKLTADGKAPPAPPPQTVVTLALSSDQLLPGQPLNVTVGSNTACSIVVVVDRVKPSVVSAYKGMATSLPYGKVEPAKSVSFTINEVGEYEVRLSMNNGAGCGSGPTGLYKPVIKPFSVKAAPVAPPSPAPVDGCKVLGKQGVGKDCAN